MTVLYHVIMRCDIKGMHYTSQLPGVVSSIFKTIFIFKVFSSIYMGEISKFPKSGTLEIQNLKHAVCLQNYIIKCL